eukprot:Sspe_Gene.33::Locus_11_Transcript_1_1_Confidence_1.000_Length_1200::g.33::m.33/K01623/ALDO; fructose-bisphosphate aldolase, class I
MLLKPNMVVNGADSKLENHAVEVARATVTTLARTLPAAVPGVCFLSGGLSEKQSSAFLNAMNQITDIPRPWALRFSYARAAAGVGPEGVEGEGGERSRGTEGLPVAGTDELPCGTGEVQRAGGQRGEHERVPVRQGEHLLR